MFGIAIMILLAVIAGPNLDIHDIIFMLILLFWLTISAIIMHLIEKKIRKSTTTVAEKISLIVAIVIVLFALIIAVMADIPDTMFKCT